MADYRVLAASRLGSEHRRVARNNQDAWAVRGAHPRVAMVVADGCSMGASSEVGASLAAAWLTERIAGAPGTWRTAEDAAAQVAALATALDEALRGWITQLGEPVAVASRYFLFSFLCAVVEDDRATIFGCGDGVWSIAGRAAVLDPGPDNAPPYAAYRVLPPEALEPGAAVTAPVVHHHGALAAGSPLYIATDGAAPIVADLEQWLSEPALWRSPRALERRLNIHQGRLADDTTIAALRAGGESCA